MVQLPIVMVPEQQSPQLLFVAILIATITTIHTSLYTYF